jgi:hypothetical protein
VSNKVDLKARAFNTLDNNEPNDFDIDEAAESYRKASDGE